MSRTVPLAAVLFSLTFFLFSSCVNPAGDAPGDPAGPAVLIFSEYLEGSTPNSIALEVTNIGESPANLHDYFIHMYLNGNINPSVMMMLDSDQDPDSPALAPGESHLLVHTSIADTIGTPPCDQESAALMFDGNDALLLVKDGEVLDSIGKIGENPGEGWTGSTTGVSTCDSILRRVSTVDAGDSNPDDAFDPDDEWLGFSDDDFGDLGQF